MRDQQFLPHITDLEGGGGGDFKRGEEEVPLLYEILVPPCTPT